MNNALKITGIVLLWVMTLMLAFAFIAQGINKFPDHGGWARAFANWHFPVWFRYFIGVVELAAGVMILWPRTAPVAAAMIVVVMLGGMATHVWWHRPKDVFHEATPLAFATIVGIVRVKKRWRSPAPMREPALQ